LPPKKNDSTFDLSASARDMITNQAMAKTSMAVATKAVRVSGMKGSLEMSIGETASSDLCRESVLTTRTKCEHWRQLLLAAAESAGGILRPQGDNPDAGAY
jgi:hypothetical protein